jgi:hypothetical protein
MDISVLDASVPVQLAVKPLKDVLLVRDMCTSLFIMAHTDFKNFNFFIEIFNKKEEVFIVNIS